MESRQTTPAPVDLQKWQEELDTPLENDVLDEFGVQSKYDFRIAARETQAAGFTWMDQDESGNYDPAQERRRTVAAPFIKRRRVLSECVDDGVPKRPKVYTWRQGRSHGQQLTVKLKIISEAGKACLRAFGTALDNWPPPQSCASNTVKQSSYWSDTINTDFTASNTFGEGPYQFRKRDICNFRTVSTYNGCDPPDLSNITLGKPEARGCKACLALRVRCPLLDEGSGYPCDECKTADVDCELIMEPKEKRRCEGCRKKRLVCSYEEGSDPSWPCRSCFKHSFKCVAGPKSGRTRTGPSLDQCLMAAKRSAPSVHKSRNFLRSCQANELDETSRKAVSEAQSATECCDQCSVARKRWCSLSRGHSRSRCGYCQENGFTCAPEPAAHHELRMTRRGGGKPAAIDEKQTQEAQTIARVPLQGKTIVTKLAHPVNFNYINTEGDGVIDCHWCEDLYYGLQGLGKAELEVKDLGDAQGYLEVGNGFTAAGFLPSRMCHGCTTDRMSILVCKGHNIEALENVNLDHSNYEMYMNWLEPGKASSAPFPWCSVCPAPAVYKCGTTDDSFIEADLTFSLPDKGCGLHLCEPCAVMLVGEHASNLEGLIDELERNMEKTEGIFELRADANLLHPRGELTRRWPYLTDG